MVVGIDLHTKAGFIYGCKKILPISSINNERHTKHVP